MPFALIHQTVEVHRRGGLLRIFHRGLLVTEHPELPGRHQLRILPEHGPGAIARTARQRPSTPPSHGPVPTLPIVEIRDLALYDVLLGDTEIAAPLLRVAPGGHTEPGLAGVELR